MRSGRGKLIQIVDVKGRECTDFQAFSLRALGQGLERDIDPTTTRTLMGSVYPGPGLYSKYFTVDQEPLVEIVQDTCGRHDAFGLACAARFYDDMGYPGHPNCSDNISAEAVRFGIRPRAGWPAINFFFNTIARRQSCHRDGRALVAPGGFRAHARPHRPRLLLERLS